jgi:acetone carboxylase gamma subunit
MTQILDSLEYVTLEGRTVYRCLGCQHELGDGATPYRDLAATFDLPITAAEPPEFAPRVEAGAFVLRHFCCPNCGRLFEVDMVDKTSDNRDSVSLA